MTEPVAAGGTSLFEQKGLGREGQGAASKKENMKAKGLAHYLGQSCPQGVPAEKEIYENPLAWFSQCTKGWRNEREE